MGRRYEEKVDIEELARLENPEDSSGGKIRVKMPNRKINEMFAIADQILGGRRVRAVCEDGESRLARIPGKMRRRQWVREGDLVIVQPWDFQDSRADVRMRYTKTQSIYLSRKGVLPEIVDLFGMTDDQIHEGDDDYEIIESGAVEEAPATEEAEDSEEEVVEEPVAEVVEANLENKTVESIPAVTIRFAGDSGDGMQLVGTRFTDTSALFGNDLATLPAFPAEIRAPQGTGAGVSSFQVQIADFYFLTLSFHLLIVVFLFLFFHSHLWTVNKCQTNCLIYQ